MGRGGARARRLIVVSNRGPVTFGRDAGGDRVARRGGGGLVTALRGLVRQHAVTWVASALGDEDRAVAAERAGEAVEEKAGDGSTYRLRLLAHEPLAYDRFYNTVANPLLWFVHHYLWPLARAPSFDRELWEAWNEGYVAVNERFAEAVSEELEAAPDAAVLFHDYHLYLAPALVRRRAPAAVLSHFVHVPWPASDSWHVLPEPIRRAVHEGLLANDVVGFHAERWRRSFLRTCEDIAGASASPTDGVVTATGGRTRTVVAPISVDVGEYDELAHDVRVLAEEAAIAAARPEFLVVRVDRTDPSKNIVRGLGAFELYLEEHPEMHGRVGMLALLDPSRQDIPEYAEYLAEIERAARALNGRFERAGWRPLDLQVQDNFPQAVAAYKQYDVLLVNAIFDGLNLVAKEAPLVNERDGVLVLSENTGAHEELGAWAITVNPFDVKGQAAALAEALSMPLAERRARAGAIRRHVRAHDIAAWAEGQLAALDVAVGARAGRIIS